MLYDIEDAYIDNNRTCPFTVKYKGNPHDIVIVEVRFDCDFLCVESGLSSVCTHRKHNRFISKIGDVWSSQRGYFELVLPEPNLPKWW